MRKGSYSMSHIKIVYTGERLWFKKGVMKHVFSVFILIHRITHRNLSRDFNSLKSYPGQQVFIILSTKILINYIIYFSFKQKFFLRERCLGISIFQKTRVVSITRYLERFQLDALSRNPRTETSRLVREILDLKTWILGRERWISG